MSDDYYTHAMWQVKPGMTDDFVRVWRDELAPAFQSVSPEATGTLIRSLQDPQLFYSFGPWPSLEQMQTARNDPAAATAIAKLRELCVTATPGPYEVVLRIP